MSGFDADTIPAEFLFGVAVVPSSVSTHFTTIVDSPTLQVTCQSSQECLVPRHTM